MMVGGQSYAAGAGHGTAVDLLCAGDAVRAVPRVSLRPDAGDLSAVVPGSERRRDVSDGRGVAGLVRRHPEARADGQYPGVVRPLDRARLGRQRDDGGDLGGRRPRVPAPVSRIGRAVLSRRREPRHAEPPGRFRHRPRVHAAGAEAEPLHLGARGAADLDLAVRPVRDVRGGQPVQPLLRGSRQRPRRQRVAAPAPCDAADPAAGDHRGRHGRVHPVV